MEALQQNDSFLNGDLKQYKKLFLIMHPDLSAKELKEITNTALIRGGLFWSDRKKSLILGQLTCGKKYSFTEFSTRLKNTI